MAMRQRRITPQGEKQSMSIVGAARIPLLLGVIPDAAGIEIATLVMVPGFLYVAWYAFWGSRIGLKQGK